MKPQEGEQELQVVFWECLASSLAGGWAHMMAVDVETGGLGQRSPSRPQNRTGLCWAHLCVILDRALRCLLKAVSSSTKWTWWSAPKELAIFPRGHAPAGKRWH